MDSQLTPDNINETLTILPESTDFGADTAGGDDDDAQALHAADALDEAYDATGEPIGLDDGLADDSVEDSTQANAPETDSLPASAEIEELRRIKAEHDQLQQWLVQQQAQAQAQQAEQYWTSEYQKGVLAYQQAEQQIYQQAQEAYDPVAFIQEQRARITQQFNAWNQQYQQSYQQAAYQQYAASQIPAYAQHVAQHYNLSDDTAVQELLKVPPDYMPREAARIARERYYQRQLDQTKRSDAARRIAANGVAPGGGRAAGGRIDLSKGLKAGSRASAVALQAILSRQ